MSKLKVLLILGTSFFASTAILFYFLSGMAGTFNDQSAAVSYFSENELVAGLSAAAIGSLFTSLIVFWIEDSRDKRQAAIHLLEEFSSFDFLETRNRAGLVFKKHLFFPLKGLDDLYFTLQNENWRYISHMEHFFKKVDKMIGLGEVDKGYILSFLRSEFPHWYNSYFFPAALADITRQHEGDTEEQQISGVALMPLKDASQGSVTVGDQEISLPLQSVDYISAFGAADRPETRQKKTREVAAFVDHVEQLVDVSILKKSEFRRSGAWKAWEEETKPDYLRLYEGDLLPFPELRKLIRKG